VYTPAHGYRASCIVCRHRTVRTRACRAASTGTHAAVYPHRYTHTRSYRRLHSSVAVLVCSSVRTRASTALGRAGCRGLGCTCVHRQVQAVLRLSSHTPVRTDPCTPPHHLYTARQAYRGLAIRTHTQMIMHVDTHTHTHTHTCL